MSDYVYSISKNDIVVNIKYCFLKKIIIKKLFFKNFFNMRK
nr:MAG TPA: hypothetical protein [Caudoviricetes sp.]